MIELKKRGNTIVREFDSRLMVWYYNTMILDVDFSTGYMRLSAGSKHTRSTKARLNQASSEFNLDFRVYQKNFDWYVEFQGDVIPFQGPVTLQR